MENDGVLTEAELAKRKWGEGFWLGTISSPGSNGAAAAFRRIRWMSEDEWRAACDDSMTLERYVHRNAFLFAAEKAHEWQTARNTHTRRLLDNPHAGRDGGLRFDLLARFAVWLLAFRVFLDHTETRLKRTYGEDSRRVAAFKELTSTTFDASTSYRLAYGLRNYLHVDLPGAFESRAWLDEATGETHTSLDLILNAATLLERLDGWHRTTRQDLESGPAEISVSQLIADAHGADRFVRAKHPGFRRDGFKK